MRVSKVHLLCAAIAASLVAGLAHAAPGDFDSGLYFPINDETLVSLNGAQGVVNGNAAISFVSPTLDGTQTTFDGTLDSNDEVATFRSTINLRGAVTLEVRVDAAGDFSQEIPLPSTALPAITVGDVVVTPFAAGTIKVSGTADASGSVSVVAPFEAGAQFELVPPGQPAISFPTVPRFKPELGAPDATAAIELNADLEVGVVFLVAINGVEIGGPSLSTLVGIDLHVSGLPSPAWNADIATELRGGWTFLPEIPERSIRVVPDSRNVAGDALSGGLSSSRWSRVYDLLDSETSAAFVKSGDGAVLMGNSRFGTSPWMSEIDGLGDPAWQNSAVSQPFGSMNAKSLIQASNGDLLAAGWTGESSGMRVERYSASGTPLWARTMAGQGSTAVAWNASVPTSSGGAILAGHISYGATQRCVFAEIDQTGAILWINEVDLGADATNPTVNAIALTSTGEILAAGTVTYQDLPSPYDAALRQDNGLVLRLHADGTAASAFAVGGNLKDVVTNLAVFPDNSYAIGGYSVPKSGSGLNSAWITSFEANDVMRWSATYAGETNGLWGHVSAMATLPSHGLLVTGGFGTPTTTEEAWLCRLDRAGTPLWFKSLRGPNDDTLTGVLKMNHGGVLAFGHTKSVNDVLPSAENDLWVVRTSVDGMVDFTAASGMDASNDEARWRRSSHVVRPLTPTNVPATLTSTVAPLDVVPASATYELLTP